MVILDSIHLSINGQQPYFKINQTLKGGENRLNLQLEDYELLVDEVKLDDSGNVIMVQDPQEGEIPLIETKHFDKEVKGMLTMDFKFAQNNGNISTNVISVPKGVDGVLGYKINATINNNARRNNLT